MFLGRTPLFAVGDADEGARGDRQICRLRVAMALSGLIAFTVGHDRTTPHTAIGHIIVGTYAVAALVQAVWVRRASTASRSWMLVSHGLDIAAAAVLTLLTRGMNVPPFLFLTFPLLTAASRWGLVETLVSAAAALIALSVELALFISPVSMSRWISEEFRGETTFVLAAYVVIGGIAVGYLGDLHRQRRSEWWALAEMTRSARLEGGLSGTLHSVLLAFARTFRAARALLIVRDAATSKNFLVDVRRDAGAPRGYSMTSSELDAETSSLYLFDASGDCWYGVQRLRSPVRSVTAIDQSGRVMHGGTIRLPASFELRYPCRRLLGVSLQVDPEWQGRLLLLDPDVGGDPDEVVTFAQRIARDIAPAIRQVSVVERVRRGAETIERQRLARELHDGPIQTLHAALLQLQTMGAVGPAGAPSGVCDAGAVEALLRDQIANLRDITQAMRLAALETDSPHLVRDAAAIVDRYARQHGVEARFVSSVDSVAVPATVSHELLRILQEALTNVTKHSHARQALVSLRLTGDRLVLTVEDNGCGFPFEGRRTHRELLASKEGPLVISERTAALGGDLVVESSRGTGARVEVRVPVSIERPVALFR